jgi:hypothetical protein
MKQIPVLIETPVAITRIHVCDLCHDRGEVELADNDGFPSGYYQECICVL